MSDPKTKGATQGEPSMEEILASIRRIISEDGDPAKAAPASTPAAPPAAPATPPPAAVAPPEPPPPPRVQPPTAPQPPAPPSASEVLELTDVVEELPPLPPEPPAPPPVAGEDGLVSSGVASAASGALASLASAKRQTERGMVNNPMHLGDPGATIESIVREELRPILKAWLDQNLPAMVERLVQREIQRIARNVD